VRRSHIESLVETDAYKGMANVVRPALSRFPTIAEAGGALGLHPQQSSKGAAMSVLLAFCAVEVDRTRLLFDVQDEAALHLLDTRPPEVMEHLPRVPGGACYLSLPALFDVHSGGQSLPVDGMYLVEDHRPDGRAIALLVTGAPPPGSNDDTLQWCRLAPGIVMTWNRPDALRTSTSQQEETLNRAARVALNFLLYLENGFTTTTEVRPRIPKSPGKRKRLARRRVAMWPHRKLELSLPPSGARGERARHWTSAYWNYYWVRDPGGAAVLDERVSEETGAALKKVAKLVRGHYRGG
jgi:hypothetical protein